ncbi:hypothetical protein FHS16_002509 [Paenibacillus endophyticus]|uniref:Uncharacterized protein n=1 Tax=Paenibacillus endophyticus TaxID=1294268 RepID=A0A7W5C831_9BACL|nr:hypothetical protein [Paenibacillus endophyticus]MBB3152459.1 hypothetical protein [Paenibacillus endophyticus]
MMSDITQQMIGDIIAKAESAIKNFERDNEEYPLFEIVYDEKGNFEELLFNENIMTFFGLLLGCRNFWKLNSDEPSLTQHDYDVFLTMYFEDIKMALLKDAMVNLTNYFEVQSGSAKIKKELFYEASDFKEKVVEYISKTGLTDPDKLIAVIEDHVETIHLKVPKICFPWYAYALCFSYKKFPKWDNRKMFNIINGEFLALKWTRSEYPKEQEIMEQAQRNFKIFIQSLAGSEDAKMYNCSLNLFLFNEVTNLYDIYNLVNLFRDDSGYMKYQNLRLENTQVTIDKKHYKERNKYKREMFNGVGHIAAINSFGVKTLLINNYYVEQLFTDERVWDVYNKIFDLTKRCLLQEVKENHLSKHSEVSGEIRLDYCVYSLLNNEKSYKWHLEDMLKSDLPIYVPSPDEIKTHLYEAYSSAYKSFYDCRHKGKEGINLLKY